MSAQSFLSELKRRQIYRGGVMYVVAGWVIVQVAATVFPYFHIPEWAIRLLVVAILLGFPVALVALWMFESSLPDPNTRLHERRAGGREGVGSDELTKLLQAERVERARETQELIAALGQLKGSTSAGALASDAANSLANGPTEPVQLADPAATVAAPAIRTPPRRRGAAVLVAALLAASVLAATWMLGTPEVSTAQASAATTEITQQYMTPGYRYIERLGVAVLTPVLHKFGIGWNPRNVFTVLMVLLALFVVHRTWRGFADNRRVRRTAREA